jgi:hypothetical protein
LALTTGLNIYDGVAVGFVVIFVVSTILDRFGDAMFRRGVARPFYILGRRLHHRRFLLLGIPLLYASLAFLVLVGWVRVVWSLLWTGLAGTIVVAVACVAFDLALDYTSTGGFRRGILHHELIYLLIPAYAFADFLRLVI